MALSIAGRGARSLGDPKLVWFLLAMPDMDNPVQPKESCTERKILENLNVSVLLFDTDLRLRYINPAGEMLFASSARHMIGVPAIELVQCAGGQVERDLRITLDTGQPFSEREVLLGLPDGRQVTVDCTISPLKDLEGPTEVLVELQQKDRQLRITREEQLIAQHQTVRELVRGLAHEVKNPLGGLRGAAQLLERELPDDSLYEYTHIIIDEAARLHALVDRMLGPNRLPNKQAVNIHYVLERVRHLVQAEIGDRIALTRDYDPSIPLLEADSDQLIQALLNLVRNATRAAGERGQVTLRTRVLRQFTLGNVRHRLVLKVDVEDNGPGIAPELLPGIFFPMVSGSHEGAGLGLPIAQSLISEHGGLIECSSRHGETTFSVLLPLEVGDDQGS